MSAREELARLEQERAARRRQRADEDDLIRQIREVFGARKRREPARLLSFRLRRRRRKKEKT